MTTLQSVKGALPTAKTALYTCPANTRSIVKSFTVANVHVANHVFIIYVGTFEIVRFDINEQDTWFADKEIILEAGETIEGQCPDSADYMHYKLNIAEITDLLTA